MKKLGHLREDTLASLVVFVVAIPLTLGIALASGVSPAAAIISAVVGGVLVGVVSGAPLMVSGPAAGLATLVFMIVQQFGILGLAVATGIAGLIQVFLGVFRLGHIFTLVPKSILNGMLAAIGLTIALGQMHVWLGGSVPSNPLKGILELPTAIANVFPPILALGVLGILIQTGWGKFAGRLKWIPGALPAVASVTVVALFMDGVPRVELAPIMDSLKSQVQIWSSFELSSVSWSLIGAGLGLGLVASAESLLTARAIDGIAPTGTPKSKLNRELLAQGLGNLVCSGLGAMPITGVMVRSAANVDSGARTRRSTIMHGMWVAIFVLALPFVLNAIPLTALASVLILTGIKLIGFKAVLQSIERKPIDAAFWFITVASIMIFNLLNGLVLSLVLYSAYYYISVKVRKNLPEPESA